MNNIEPRLLYKERNQRVMDAISLKEPDRVPITPLSHFYPMIQKGMTIKEAMYDSLKSMNTAIEVFSNLKFDQFPTLVANWDGNLFDALGVKIFKWPGANDEAQRLSDNQPFQFVEGEYMKADEYEEFFMDPTGYLLRKLIPRYFTKLKFLSEFPPIGGLINGFISPIFVSLFLSFPLVQNFNEKILEIKKAFLPWINNLMNYEKQTKKLGFPIQFANTAQAPFDIISDFLRGMKGSMLDMYRKPEELKNLINVIVKPTINATLELSKLLPKYKVIFMPLHRGAEGFMSNEQFEIFYWPSLTKVMEGLIERGFIPMPLFEGKYDDRYPYLEEFAKKNKGKLIYSLDQSDILKAKEFFGDYVCIRGNVPRSLLNVGTSQQVKEYVKNCIEGCMTGGGYLIDGAAGITDEAKPENVKAMCDASFEYGVYRK